MPLGNLVAEAFGQAGRRAGDVVHEFIAGLGMPRSLAAVGVGPAVPILTTMKVDSSLKKYVAVLSQLFSLMKLKKRTQISSTHFFKFLKMDASLMRRAAL